MIAWLPTFSLLSLLKLAEQYDQQQSCYFSMVSSLVEVSCYNHELITWHCRHVMYRTDGRSQV